MTSKSTVSTVYKGVINDVVKNVREKFLNEGVDEQVLQELKQLWESKLQQTRAVDGLEVPLKPLPQQTLVYPHNQAVPSKIQMTVHGQTVQMPVANAQALAAHYPTFKQVVTSGGLAATSGVKVKQSQLDGTRSDVDCSSDVEGSTFTSTSKRKQRVVVQLDGTKDGSSSSEDDEEEEVDQADADKDAAQEDDEAPLGPDDDESDEEEEPFDTDNLVVCQFDRVGRVRNKWRFNLKDGIMNLTGKDYVFHKATGEAEW